MRKVMSLMAVFFILASPIYATVTDTESPVKVYTSATVTAYPIPFDYIDDEDIEVTLVNATTGAETAQALNVDYTIVSDTVTYATAPGSAYKVVIRRVTPFTQEASWVAGSAPPLSAWESAFDKLTFLTQDLSERVDRAPLIPVDSPVTSPSMPDPARYPGQYIRINSGGTDYEAVDLGGSSGTINLAKLSDYADFGTMVSTIGATEKTIFVDTVGTLSANTTIPSTLHLIMLKGGAITLGNYNLTINGPFLAGLSKVFNVTGTGVVSFGACSVKEVFPDWFGAYYGGDCTAAIQYALDAAPAGGRVKLQPYDYLTTSTITVKNKNRITLEGDGLSTGIKFSPTTDDDTAIAIDGDCDNVTLHNFNLVYSNNNAATGGVGCRVYTGATAITFDRVYFADWLDKGLEMDTAYYAKIRYCRFMNCDNSALDTALAVGLYITAGANNTIIEGCQFTENDYALRILAGNAVIIRDNSFEANGNSGNAFGISSQIGLATVNNLNFTGNYVEGNYTGNTNAVLDLDTCYGAIVDGNVWSGQTPGNTDVSDRLIGLTDCAGTRIAGNVFKEWKDYCITSNNNSLTLLDNHYEDGTAALTDHNTIHAQMSITGGAYFGIPISFTWDPGSLADGAGETKTVIVAGAAAGDAVIVGCPGDMHDSTITAYVHSSDRVGVRLQNESGGTLDMPSGTYYLHIIKKR